MVLVFFERVAKLCFTTRKQIRALAPHAKKLRFSTLANLSVKNPWRMSPDFSDFIEIGLRPKSLIDFCNSLPHPVSSRVRFL